MSAFRHVRVDVTCQAESHAKKLVRLGTFHQAPDGITQEPRWAVVPLFRGDKPLHHIVETTLDAANSEVRRLERADRGFDDPVEMERRRHFQIVCPLCEFKLSTTSGKLFPALDHCAAVPPNPGSVSVQLLAALCR